MIVIRQEFLFFHALVQTLSITHLLVFRFEFATGTDLERVVEKCPFTMTGADFYALCSDAMLNALKRKIEMLEKGR